jgi:ribosome-binding protein aMBF1 (putative translation factor)
MRGISPIGASVSEVSRQCALRSPAYRQEQARLEPYEQIARIVIQRRLELGLSQQQLAKRMGTSPSAVSRIERGQHPASPQMLQRLATTLERRI